MATHMALASNNLPFKYTDENYVTKQGFFSALGSSLVDRLWDSVVKYRDIHASKTMLRSITALPFFVTETEVLKDKFQAFRAKLLSLKEQWDRFIGEEEKEKAFRLALYSCLKDACSLENIHASEPMLKAMISGIYREDDPTHVPLLAYRDFLKGNVGHAFGSVDTFFADVFSSLSGTEELVSFYRVSDPGSIYTTVLLGRVYDCAPYIEIENMMNNLETFVASDKLLDVSKALLATYFVDYVQPFVSHNALMSISLGKRMLQDILGDVALILPLEKVLLDKPRSKELYVETQKTGDFTYVLLRMIEVLDPLLDSLLNDWVKLRTDALRREFNSMPVEELPHQEEVPLEELPTPEEPPRPVEVSAPPQPILEEKEEEPEIEELPLEEEKPVAPRPRPRTVDASVPAIESLPETSKVYLSPRPSLSDKEVKMAARYILETHPELNRQQALFFASHSVPGRYYSIQDYKKTMKVAYETARTSMDRLAGSKFYKKLRIKNKYVYTPRTAGEKE